MGIWSTASLGQEPRPGRRLDVRAPSAHIPGAMTAPNDLFAATMAAAGFVPPELPEEQPKPETLEAADRLSRSWTSSRIAPT